MFNTDYPDRADLPTTERLIRSTILAGISAVVILVTVVLPSEYGIDPTRVGGLLGLTPMGQIKVQLAEEAAAQTKATIDPSSAPAIAAPAVIATQTAAQAAAVEALQQRVAALEALVTPAQPTPAADTVAAVPQPLVAPEPERAPQQTGWKDEISFTLTPGQGAEYKLVMAAGAVATFEFTVEGGVINYDQHGEGGGQSFSYDEQRGVESSAGSMQAPVEGTHGWFFRNRGTADVVVTLRTGGDYVELRKLI
jgi:hypothetical protein